jgi:hypothetical protein
MIASDTQIGVKVLAKPAQSIHGEEFFVHKLPLDGFSQTRGLCSRWRKLMRGATSDLNSKEVPEKHHRKLTGGTFR